MNRAVALVPLCLLSACATHHLGITPGSSIQIQVPVGQPRPYIASIGDPQPVGQPTPLSNMVIGALTAAKMIDRNGQAGSRPVRLARMIGREGKDFYVSYTLGVQSALQGDGHVVSIIDQAGQELTLTSNPPDTAAHTTTASPEITPHATLVAAPDGKPMAAAQWVVRLKHVQIGYNALGIADYFRPIATADVVLLSGPAGSKPLTVELSVAIMPGKYHFFTFSDILRHPSAATEGLVLATRQLARDTALAIEAKPPTT